MHWLRRIAVSAGFVLALAIALAIADGTLWRWWSMPPRAIMVGPIPPDSELARLMYEAYKSSQADEHRRAAELYTKALAIQPGPDIISQDLHALRGSEYNFLGMMPEAFADYDAAIRIYYYKPLSDSALRAYMGRGYAAVNLAKYRLAIADFDVVLGVLPNDVPRSSSTLAWRGAAYQGLGDRARAVADYRAALALDPNNAYAHHALQTLGEL